jgi:adenylate cyclase, class 2
MVSGAMKNNTETEVKIPLADPAAVESRLRSLGFRQSVPREWESNDLYDTKDQSLRNKEMLLRLRQSGDRSVITWKGPGQAGPHKARPELETDIGSVEVLGHILEQLGYARVFRYEKYRTEYSGDQQNGVVTIDETPIGNFMEIEGPGDWIDSVASQLGFSSANYILESYGKLYLEHCQNHGLEPGDMVFASHSVKAGSEAKR